MKTRFDITTLSKVKWAKRDLLLIPIFKANQVCFTYKSFNLLFNGLEKFTEIYDQ